MKLSWLWLNQIPVGVELSADQKRELSRRIWAFMRKPPPGSRLGQVFAMTVVPVSIALGLAFTIGVLALIRQKLPGGPYAAWLVGMIFAFQALEWTAVAYAYRRIAAPICRRVLNDMGVLVCMACGYPLAGLGDDPSCCPECGERREGSTPPTSPSSSP